jgi:hypothetical protein
MVPFHTELIKRVLHATEDDISLEDLDEDSKALALQGLKCASSLFGEILSPNRTQRPADAAAVLELLDAWEAGDGAAVLGACSSGTDAQLPCT